MMQPQSQRNDFGIAPQPQQQWQSFDQQRQDFARTQDFAPESRTQQFASAFSLETLEPIMIGFSFVPTFFAITFLATATENESFKDKSGVSGFLSAMSCLAFGMLHSVAVNQKSIAGCKILIMARAILGILAIFFSGFLAILIGKKALGLTALYFMFGVFSLPEGFFLLTFAEALAMPPEEEEPQMPPAPPMPQTQQEPFGLGAPPQHWGGVVSAPPQSGPPHFSGPVAGGDDFGLASGGGYRGGPPSRGFY